MGLFIKIIEPGLPRAQAGWRQIRDEDIEDYHDGVDVLCYTENYGRCPVSCFEVLEEVEADDFEDLAYYYFKKTVSELEASGWIRIMNGIPDYRGRISQAQYNKCTELGIEIPEYNVLWQ